MLHPIIKVYVKPCCALIEVHILYSLNDQFDSNAPAKKHSGRTACSGRSKWGQGRAPLGVQIFSFSCSFRQKNRLAHPLWELAPTPQENPGSATGMVPRSEAAQEMGLAQQETMGHGPFTCLETMRTFLYHILETIYPCLVPGLVPSSGPVQFEYIIRFHITYPF